MRDNRLPLLSCLRSIADRPAEPSWAPRSQHSASGSDENPSAARKASSGGSPRATWSACPWEGEEARSCGERALARSVGAGALRPSFVLTAMTRNANLFGAMQKLVQLSRRVPSQAIRHQIFVVVSQNLAGANTILTQPRACAAGRDGPARIGQADSGLACRAACRGPTLNLLERSVLRSLHVAAVLGLDDDPSPDRNMRRDHHTRAIGELRGLIG